MHIYIITYITLPKIPLPLYIITYTTTKKRDTGLSKSAKPATQFLYNM